MLFFLLYAKHYEKVMKSIVHVWFFKIFILYLTMGMSVDTVEALDVFRFKFNRLMEASSTFYTLFMNILQANWTQWEQKYLI